MSVRILGCVPAAGTDTPEQGVPGYWCGSRPVSRDDCGVAEQRLPSGVVTFVLTDIVGSTRLWERAPVAMETALARHEEVLRGTIADHGGVLLKGRGEGDSTFSVFTLATDALAAAYAAQVALVAARWPAGAPLTVRFGVHSGESVERDGDFLGPEVNRAARLRAAARGGEVLVSESTARLVADRLPSGVRLVELGPVRLRDLDRPVVAYVLTGPGLPEPRAGPDSHAVLGVSSERGVSPKEGEVLELLSEHLTNAEIASRLYISERTVESHVSSLLRKFQVANRHELARILESPVDRESSGGPVPSRARGFPTAATPLIDREDESAKIASLLSQHRLVTLIGPGGTGKTRLATHVVSTAVECRSSESWCAEFASVAGTDHVAEVLLASLGVRSSTEMEMADQVARYLAARAGLLLLDNCEHVRAPVAAICERILQLAPDVRILATSRELLGVVGEVLFPVPPLRTPSDNTPETIAKAHAVQLFVERAQSYSPDFRLDGDNSAAVGELCRCLDGLPLAIELAAARILTMTPQEIVSRLDHLFRVLGHRSDRIDHHRTLRATLDWSYELLEADEKALLSQLATFAPGFSLAAVETVGHGTSQDRYVLDVLSGLVAKSMVVAETETDTGTTRLRLLETVRAYGLEKAMETGARDVARRRHVEFYSRLADELVGPTVISDLDARSQQLAAEASNIRLALSYAVDMNDARAVFELAASIVDVWCLWGWGGAILNALEAALESDDSEGPGRADALANAAWSAWSQGRHAKATQWCEESAQSSASAGEPPVARVYIIRGLARLLDEGDRPGGMALCEQGLELLLQSGHLRRYAHDLASYGAYLAVIDETDRSASASAESMTLARQLSDKHTLSFALNALGYLSVGSDSERAREYFGEVVAIGDPWCTASATWGLGWIDDLAGRERDALHGYGEALRLWSETGDWRGIFYAIEGISIVAGRTGRPISAVQLLGGADAIAPDVGSGSMSRWNTWRDQHRDMLRDALSPVDFSINWATGQRLEPDVLVKEALMTAQRTEGDLTEAAT
jgi:predicted ATPase/class 3 adenylate cyclase/DNA-binding CsgD family transcriptional regulator